MRAAGESSLRKLVRVEQTEQEIDLLLNEFESWHGRRRRADKHSQYRTQLSHVKETVEQACRAVRSDLLACAEGANWIEEGVDVRATTAKVANAVVRARNNGADIAVGVLRWAELALGELAGAGAIGSTLRSRIANLVKSRRLAETPTWIYAVARRSRLLWGRT